jgi:hypothetical protein
VLENLQKTSFSLSSFLTPTRRNSLTCVVD